MPLGDIPKYWDEIRNNKLKLWSMPPGELHVIIDNACQIPEGDSE